MSEAPIPSAPADLELIAQLRTRLQYAELRIRVLEEQLRLMRIEKYGAGGEKLSHAQLELFELEPVVSEMIERAESECRLVRRPKPRSCKHPGRQELPSNLPRVERILPCTPDQRVCKSCGKETVVIGYEESSQLDVEPAKYFVLVTKREKRACRSCEELGVVSAPLPPRIIEKCLASDRIVIDTVISKYCNHIPLHRQSMILERDIGLEISRATLDGWVLKVGEFLIPMVAAMRRELISGRYIQADETPVDVQAHEGRGQNHQAYLWQYSRPGGTVVFDFRLGRGRDGPKRFLGEFEGILQTDGYAAYDQIGGPRMVHAACWAHARRQFFEAAQLNPRDPVATRLWRGWTNCLPSTRKLAADELALLGVMLCVRKEPSLCWMISVARSRQRSPLHCPPVHSARPANTRSHRGRNLHDSWNIPNLSLAITWRKIQCVPWLWAGRTGYTSAVHRRGPRSRRFSRSWKAAAG